MGVSAPGATFCRIAETGFRKQQSAFAVKRDQRQRDEKNVMRPSAGGLLWQREASGTCVAGDRGQASLLQRTHKSVGASGRRSDLLAIRTTRCR
ncbi:hypothetical protein C4K10_3451 [Pseudomonas chlororaphis subsp. aureofaciens]|nr:hypothetical protein C4K10_3451 [Pseudomonas chlororaphis subsp. aureofaciens]